MGNDEKTARIEKLKLALAINRGIEFLGQFKPSSHVTQTQWAGYLEELFRQIRSKLFADTMPVSPEERLVGLVENVQKAYQIGGAFHEFSCQFFDQNGFFASINRHHNACLLAELFIRLEKARPFHDYNRLTLRVFFTALGRMRGFNEKVGTIDFRRLSNSEVEFLLQESKALTGLTQVFESAMDPTRDPIYPNDAESYFHFEDRSISILGKRFIQVKQSHPLVEFTEKPRTDEPLIVMIDGRLVPISEFKKYLQLHIEAGQLLGSLRIPNAAFCGRLTNLGNDMHGNSIAEKTVIDYVDVTKGSLPICMNLHPMTLLSHSQHQRLEGYLASEYGAKITDLSDPELARRVAAGVADHPRALQIVELSTHRIQQIVRFMKQTIEEELAAHPTAKVTDGQPLMVMTMGGSGSGKGSNQFFNKHYTEADGSIRKDFIYASLDEGRPYSDIYHVLLAAGHHADDYEAVHDWANTRRNWLCVEARKRNYNVLYDGSGVDYAGRYDKIVAEFKQAGYRNVIHAADCMLYIPPSRREEFPTGALERIMLRAGYQPDGTPLADKETGHYRTLPWRIALNKHIGFPSSLIAALSDVNLDKIVLVDNAGPKGTDYVMGESFLLDDEVLAKLDAAQQSRRLIPALVEMRLLPEGCNASKLVEANTDFLAVRVRGRNHIFVITNVERMVDVIEKGQLNPNAHGPENLTFVKRNASFLIDRLDKPNGVSSTPVQVELAYRQARNQLEKDDITRPNYLRMNSGS